MTRDILKMSVAESVRYLRAYGEERLREAEEIWNSLEDDEHSDAPEPYVEPIELPNRSTLQLAALEEHVSETPNAVQPSRSFLQRLLGW